MSNSWYCCSLVGVYRYKAIGRSSDEIGAKSGRKRRTGAFQKVLGRSALELRRSAPILPTAEYISAVRPPDRPRIPVPPAVRPGVSAVRPSAAPKFPDLAGGPPWNFGGPPQNAQKVVIGIFSGFWSNFGWVIYI